MHEKAEVHNTKKNWKKEPKFIKGSSLVCCKFFVKRDAFTLIELLIVVAITAILSTASFLSLSNFRGMQNLRKTVDEVNAVVVGTQKRSMTQDKGNRWNVRFSNSTSTGSQMMVFSSSSYSAGVVDRTYTLNRSILFSEPSIGNIFDASFSPITGVPQSKKIISMWTGRKDGFVGDIIMNTAGLVTKRTDSGFVGYWHFDENASTTAYDASGIGNNGTIVSGPIWQTGTSCITGSCLSFNGSSGGVNIPSNEVFNFGTGDFSLSGWFYIPSLPGTWKSIINRGSAGSAGYGMELNSGSQITCSIQAAGGTNQHVGGSIPTINAWHHAVCVFGRNSMVYVYLDGVLSTSAAYGAGNNGSVSTSNPTTIGMHISGTWNFNGIIDEVKIYNRALSATEILNQYNDLK
ncbi:MAG: LamG-like jellyroll fold domain-containing protein [bacterium]